jgi:2,4-didehydro-3-deoxy-L-rhamnonate hydrolase
VPETPLLFAKFSTALIEDGDPIVLPPGIGHVDSEAELAVVIGAPGHKIDPADVHDHIAGFMCANDVSARDAQIGDGQWFRAKGYDTFCPVGPRLVPSSELGDANDLRIVQRLNGEVLQDARTSDLIFGIPDLVAYASSVMTLLPGDLILTGTPEGIGFFRAPKVTMAPGDIVEVEIEGIGVLRNHVTSG